MRLFLEFFVKDMLRSADFYCGVLGFDVFERQKDIIKLLRGDALIHVLPVEDSPEALSGHESAMLAARVEICLEVANKEELEELLAKVEKEGWPVRDPLSWQSWKRWDFRIQDPDGAYIRCTTPYLGQPVPQSEV